MDATLEADFRSKIPYIEGTKEYTLYEALIPALGNPRDLLVITDIEQDIDDLLAILILCHMHNLGIVRLVGFIANHKPTTERASFLRTILHLQGLPDIPVAVGTNGTAREDKKEAYWYELKNITFEQQPWNKDHQPLSGSKLIHELACQANKRKLSVLCLSSLQDVSEYLNQQDDAFIRARFAHFISQGGFDFVDGSLKPDMNAMNNKFHPEAAGICAKRVTEVKVSSDAWGKEVAVAAALDRGLLNNLPGPVGYHIGWVAARQEYQFYWAACYNPYRPGLDKAWYLETRMGLSRDSPGFKEMCLNPLTFCTALKSRVLPAYDACAAMGALGDGVLRCLGIFANSTEAEVSPMHRAFREKPVGPVRIDCSNLKMALQTFLRGSLLATKQLAESLVPRQSIQYLSPNSGITLEVFQMQRPYLERLVEFKTSKGLQEITPDILKQFMKETFGDNKLRDESGNFVRDQFDTELPMVPEIIPYGLLFADECPGL